MRIDQFGKRLRKQVELHIGYLQLKEHHSKPHLLFVRLACLLAFPMLTLIFPLLATIPCPM